MTLGNVDALALSALCRPISADIFPFLPLAVDSPVGFGKMRFARGELSGNEMVRLLNILADSSNGATRYELTVLDAVNAALVYQAVELNLVDVKLDSNRGMPTYRFHLADAGRRLLRSGLQNDEDCSHSR